MLWLKACPRCCGDLLWQSDIYGPYMGCLQCGHVLRPEEADRVQIKLAPFRRKQPETAAKIA